MDPGVFTCTGALDPEYHARLYIERPEDQVVRRALARVGRECMLISLIGARQTGKTSLLNRLLTEHTAPDSGWKSIMLDLSELAEAEGEGWYRQLILLCCEQLQQRGIGISESVLNATCLPVAIPHYGECLVYQHRLIENVMKSRFYGDTPTRQADRAEVIDRLNILALSTLNKSFNELHA